MTVELGNDFIEHFENRRHLDSCGNDLILLTLKGHLMIESMLENIVARMLGLKNLEKFNDTALIGFAQKN